MAQTAGMEVGTGSFVVLGVRSTPGCQGSQCRPGHQPFPLLFPLPAPNPLPCFTSAGWTRPAPGDCWQRGEANAVTLGRNQRIIRVPRLVPQPLADLGLPPSCCARLLEAKAGGAPPGLESRAGFFFSSHPRWTRNGTLTDVRNQGSGR